MAGSGLGLKCGKLHNQKLIQGPCDGCHSLLRDMSVSEVSQMLPGHSYGTVEAQEAAMLFPREGWAQALCLGSQAVWTWRVGVRVLRRAGPGFWVELDCTVAGHGVERKEWLLLRGLGCP